jgi:hypothetical protein
VSDWKRGTFGSWMYRVSPFEGRPYVSRTSSRTGLRRFHAPDAPRRLLGRMGSEDLMFAEIAVECEGDRWDYGGNWGSRRFICPIVLRVVFHPLRWDESIGDGGLEKVGWCFGDGGAPPSLTRDNTFHTSPTITRQSSDARHQDRADIE